jgi:hypothetical protein
MLKTVSVLLLAAASHSLAAIPELAPALPVLQRLELAAPASGPHPLAFRFTDPQAAQAPTALLEAALLPGLNPARRGEWVKAGVFLGVEVLGFLMNGKLEQEGKDLDREFIAYANAHWSIDRYLEDRYPNGARGEFAHEELWRADPDDEWVSGTGSHVLPIAFEQGDFGQPEWWVEGNAEWHLVPTQQFYEMIGKYAQFQRGWDDYGADRAWVVTFSAPTATPTRTSAPPATTSSRPPMPGWAWWWPTTRCRCWRRCWCARRPAGGWTFPWATSRRTAGR